MTKPRISLQDLRRRIYAKAKTESSWRFCKRNRRGFGWKKWSKRWLTVHLGLYADYRITYCPRQKALPV